MEENEQDISTHLLSVIFVNLILALIIANMNKVPLSASSMSPLSTSLWRLSLPT
jgi:hypothetical protein